MIPILMYHQVADIPRKLDPLGLAMPPARFEEQMRHLAQRGYHCLTLPEAVRFVRSGRRAPTKAFVLTFDDGYQNVHSQACPILQQFGFTATVFLVAGRMGASSNWAGQDGERSALLLSWEEARDLARRRFVLGSHTLTHPPLCLLDEQSAFEEIRDSKALLEDQLGLRIDLFSYPFSDADARIKRLVRSAGYRAACGGDCGPKSLYYLWRVPCLRDDAPWLFTMKASGWYNRKIALRESPSGRLLRRYAGVLRNRPALRHADRLAALYDHLDVGSEPKP